MLRLLWNNYLDIMNVNLLVMTLLSLQAQTPPNGQTHSHRRQIVCVCLTILWGWRLKGWEWIGLMEAAARRCSVKKDVLKNENLQNGTGAFLWILQIFKSTFFYKIIVEHLWWLLLELVNFQKVKCWTGKSGWTSTI